ncbi:ribose-5-phosphate isomerase [Candidatus Pacearchaeota archaeon CG10_big_fil_rev_8_21_14_0_10_32_14]|nr:MAG: ribose-5-phosphate isomerase [Candidatus Pacearchaeota archaeon CG10_big_fil_rev_8_21_14_0_10_32_14]
MKIFIASDHAGYELKEKLKEHLEKRFFVEDIGPFEYDQKDDYPDFVIPCAEAVAKDVKRGSVGIVIGKSGQGEAMASNKVKGIRAVVYYGGTKEIIKLSKEHNDANILSLGAGFISTRKAKNVVDLWIRTRFSELEWHKRRIGKIKKYERRR